MIIIFINYPENLGFIGGGPFEIFSDKSDMDFGKKYIYLYIYIIYKFIYIYVCIYIHIYKRREKVLQQVIFNSTTTCFITTK